MFEIEFVDVKGNTRRKIVPNHRIAREVARSLAVAVGRRAIIRRRQTRYDMLLIDLETRSIVQVGNGWDEDRAFKFWKDWNFRSQKCVAVPWPEDVSRPV